MSCWIGRRPARLQIFSERAELARLEQRAGAGADGADAVELLLVDDPRKLPTEVKRLGARGKDRRALATKNGGRRLVVGDGIEAREAGLAGAPEHDCADGELDDVQLSLDVA